MNKLTATVDCEDVRTSEAIRMGPEDCERTKDQVHLISNMVSNTLARASARSGILCSLDAAVRSTSSRLR